MKYRVMISAGYDISEKWWMISDEYRGDNSDSLSESFFFNYVVISDD